MKVLVAQSYLTQWIAALLAQARLLEWVAIPFPRGSSQPRDRTGSPALQADSLLSEPPVT